MPQLFLPMLALLTGVAGPALSADFHKALDAAKRGDYAIALKEWEPLAEQGHTIAQFNLGLLFERTDQASRDFKSALKWYTRAAGQGHAVAQFNLGGMYANGRGVGQDQGTAAFWYNLAAAQGLAGAQLKLAFLYVQGAGIPKNFMRAHMWFTIAAPMVGETARAGRIIVENLMTEAQIADARILARAWMEQHKK